MAKVSLLPIASEQFRGDDLPVVAGDVAPGLVLKGSKWRWAFDDTAEEGIYSPQFIMPTGYLGTGTLKVGIHGHFASATSGNADIEVRMEAVSASDALNLNTTQSFDSANAVNIAADANAGELVVGACTITNKDSVVAGDLCILHIRRDAADGTNDTATGDFYLAGIELYEE